MDPQGDVGVGDKKLVMEKSFERVESQSYCEDLSTKNMCIPLKASKYEDDSIMNMDVEEVEDEEEEEATGTADCNNKVKSRGDKNDSINARAINTVTGYLSANSLIFDWEIPYLRRDQREKLTSPSTRLLSNEGINSSIWSLQLSFEENSNGESWISVYLWLRYVLKWPNVHAKGQYINYKIYLLAENGDVLCGKESGIRYLRETAAVGWRKYAPFSTVFSPGNFLSSGFTVHLDLTTLQSATGSHFFPLEKEIYYESDTDSRKDDDEIKFYSNSTHNMFHILSDNIAFCMEQEEIDKAHSIKFRKMILEQYNIKLDETNSVRIRSTHTTTRGVTCTIPKIVLTDVSEPHFKLVMNFIATNDISLADHGLDFHGVCELTKTACLYHIWILARKCLIHLIESWLSVDTVSIIALISELLPTTLALQNEKIQVKQYFRKNWNLVRESESFRTSVIHSANKTVFANLLLL